MPKFIRIPQHNFLNRKSSKFLKWKKKKNEQDRLSENDIVIESLQRTCEPWICTFDRLLTSLSHVRISTNNILKMIASSVRRINFKEQKTIYWVAKSLIGNMKGAICWHGKIWCMSVTVYKWNAYKEGDNIVREGVIAAWMWERGLYVGSIFILLLFIRIEERRV